MLQSVDKDEFQISKNLLVVLYKVLVAEDVANISLTPDETLKQHKLVPVFDNQENPGLLRDLYNLSKSSQVYREAVVRIHEAFTGMCLTMASRPITSAVNKVLLFRREHPDVKQDNQLDGLLKAELQSRETCDKVAHFCSRYRV